MYVVKLPDPVRAVVFIGFAEAVSAPEVVWTLADAGFCVKAFARRGLRSSIRHSSHVTVFDVTPPEEDAAAAIRDVESLMRSFISSTGQEVLILFPLDDAAVWLCSRVANNLRFTKGNEPDTAAVKFAMAGPTGDQVVVALDKSVQIQAAHTAGFHVPATRVARTVEDVLKGGEPFPVILKPAEAVVYRDNRLRKVRNWICGNRFELESAVKNWAESTTLLVQPYIAGNGEGIFGFATSDGVEAWSAHRRLRMMNPHGSGSSACVSQNVPADVLQPATHFIQQTGWHGLFMIEILRDTQGTAWFMEFNGRPWGSLALARHQGLKYPLWNAQLSMDPSWKLDVNPSIQPDIICRNVGRELMYPLFVLRGPKSSALTQWPEFWRALLDVARLSRRHVFYNWRKDDCRVFISDSYYTLRKNLLKRRR